MDQQGKFYYISKKLPHRGDEQFVAILPSEEPMQWKLFIKKSDCKYGVIGYLPIDEEFPEYPTFGWYFHELAVQV